ncbi:MAG: thermonuclease family protein [Thermodesulfobacteriota bacterium]
MLLVFLPVSLLAQESILVRYVIDGDTIILKSGEKVRYIGIDTPEIDHENKRDEPLGYAARNFNKKRVGAKGIRLEFDREKHDYFGRQLAYVFLLDNTFVNLELLQSGLATYLHKPPNLKYAEKFLQAQRKAMSDGKGVWQAWSERDQSYVGNRKSKRFHLPGCRFGRKTASGNRVEFSRQWDAFWQGYSPCKKCLKKKKAL